MKIISLVHGHWRLNQFGEAEIKISIKSVLSILHHLKKIASLKIRNPKHLTFMLLPCKLSAEYIHSFLLFPAICRCRVGDQGGIGSGTSLCSCSPSPATHITLLPGTGCERNQGIHLFLGVSPPQDFPPRNACIFKRT